MTVREYLKKKPLLFDGGMGTYFSQVSNTTGSGCELANLNQKDLIINIHKEYIDAGCNAIKTNTFASNKITYQGDEELVKRTIKAGYDNAITSIGEKDIFAFADIGPVLSLSEKQNAFDEYKFVVDCFLECGASNFIFETNANCDGLIEISKYIKEVNSEAYILCSFAVNKDGFSRDGIYVDELFSKLKACKDIDGIGLNCVCGARHMYDIAKQLNFDDKALSLMPNAGYPIVVNNRTFYEGDPAYFGEQVADYIRLGARIVGGCCGTTPKHIAKIKECIDRLISDKFYFDKTSMDMSEATNKTTKTNYLNEDNIEEKRESIFYEKLKRGEKVIAVELDPPSDINLSKFMGGAWQLKGAGTDIITIADCPIARAHMDSSILSCKIKRELGIDTLPHMTCRDRNMNATKALLLGLYAEGVRNVLLVTGDPVPTAERDEVKSVYQFNSRKLAGYVTGLTKCMLPTPFNLFGALNVNALNFDIQIKIAKDKLAKGMIGFLTQPILTKEAFENLKRARKELDGYILGGIIPVISERNARFMDSEINGINVAPEIIDMYKDKSRQEAEQLAINISSQIAKEIEPYVDGYYLMTPFGRVGLITNIIKEIKAK
ncbi:MAG: bifunctional homocysteine S-methyltransferase/methylenetetrahydrofolate reductase [Lachnospiraceae bacterium]|nr:bifunctional homocysteine S-methyltransferase/methylenetetrahydrofolate reductase [Lachnospiraceae bacterium]